MEYVAAVEVVGQRDQCQEPLQLQAAILKQRQRDPSSPVHGYLVVRFVPVGHLPCQ